MKTINRKPLFLALAGVTALGAVGTAQAVSVNPTGLGDVLIYPYYTVKGDAANPYNTLISVVNTTASTKAVKIRFREGKASAEVLDFNIFLSPYDMWTAALVPTGGDLGGVKLFTTDTTCTIPKIPVAGVDFRNTIYAGADAVSDSSLTRLREGYFEVIEMSTYTDGSVTAVNSKHASGVPKDCTKVTDTTATTEQKPPQGGLSGTASLVAPGTGFNAATDPTPLVNFKLQANYQSTGTIKPDFNDADLWSTTPDDDGNTVWASWGIGRGVDAVSGALMKNAIINEFVLDTATNSATDWVITFPTKSYYVAPKGTSVRAPFQGLLTTKGSCDEIAVNTWDREENTKQPGGPDFSPSPPADKIIMCWEANVLSFNGKNVFGSSNRLDIATNFANGWARLDFARNAPLVADSARLVVQNTDRPPTVTADSGTFTGLPAIGFAVQTFRPSLTSSYAGTYAHRWISGAK